jgi:hypothetical protein
MSRQGSARKAAIKVNREQAFVKILKKKKKKKSVSRNQLSTSFQIFEEAPFSFSFNHFRCFRFSARALYSNGQLQRRQKSDHN